MNTRQQLMTHFREWWNDYLTIQQFADDHGWTRDYAYRVINTGRKLHNRNAEKLRTEINKQFELNEASYE